MRTWLLAPCLALALYGCGDGVLCFGISDCGDDDDDERTVTVEGNLDTVRPPNAVRDIVMFAFTALDTTAGVEPFSDYKHAESVVVSEDDTFEMSRVARGDVTVVVLLDDPEPDGVIDCTSTTANDVTTWTCEDCSVLRDGGDLSDVPGGRRVTIEDMDVDFDPASCPGEPLVAGCGCSTADDIRIGRVDSGGGGSSNDGGN